MKKKAWLTDAKGRGVPAVMNFARTLMVDIQVVRNAVIKPWSMARPKARSMA
jgi:hypothetical protein